MGKIYLVLVLLLIVLLALPSTRSKLTGFSGRFDREGRRQAAESAREHAQRATDAARAAAPVAREAAASATKAARGATDAVRGAGETVSSAVNDRRWRILGRTLQISAAPTVIAPLLTEAVAQAAVVDPATPQAGESQAWVYSSLGEVRFTARAAADDAGEVGTVFGVVSFEYALGEPQGVAAAEHALDEVASSLTEHGVAFRELTRTFDPGPESTADGLRRVVTRGQTP